MAAARQAGHGICVSGSALPSRTTAHRRRCTAQESDRVEPSPSRHLPGHRHAAAPLGAHTCEHPPRAQRGHPPRVASRGHAACAARLRLRSEPALAGAHALGTVRLRRRHVLVDRPVAAPAPRQRRRTDARRRAWQHVVRRFANDRISARPRRSGSRPVDRSAGSYLALATIGVFVAALYAGNPLRSGGTC